jgi:cell division protein FtsW
MKRNSFDIILLAIVFFLVSSGIAMVFDTTFLISPGNKFGFLFKHLFYTLIGIFVILFIYKIDIPFYKEIWFSLSLSFLTIILLVAVYFFPTINKAHRWITIGSFHFQPSELAKLSIIIFLAVWLQKKKDYLDDIFSYVPVIALSVIYAGLIFFERDVGASLFILILTFSLIFLFMGTKSIPIISVPSVFFIVYALFNFEHIKTRINAFFNPEAYSSTSAYSYFQSVFAVGSGGFFGVGLGDSVQKLFFLPLSYNDYIYAIIGEEVGFIGASFVLFLYVALIYTLIRMTRKLTDLTSILLITGIAFHIGLQALINISVVLGMIPAKGLTLPFISYGGSSQLVFLTEIGLALKISKEAG